MDTVPITLKSYSRSNFRSSSIGASLFIAENCDSEASNELTEESPHMLESEECTESTRNLTLVSAVLNSENDLNDVVNSSFDENQSSNILPVETVECQQKDVDETYLQNPNDITSFDLRKNEELSPEIIRSAVKSLMCQESIQWSVGVWYKEVMQILLGGNEIINEDKQIKSLIKSIVIEEADEIVSSTQLSITDISHSQNEVIQEQQDFSTASESEVEEEEEVEVEEKEESSNILAPRREYSLRDKPQRGRIGRGSREKGKVIGNKWTGKKYILSKSEETTFPEDTAAAAVAAVTTTTITNNKVKNRIRKVSKKVTREKNDSLFDSDDDDNDDKDNTIRNTKNGDADDNEYPMNDQATTDSELVRDEKDIEDESKPLSTDIENQGDASSSTSPIVVVVDHNEELEVVRAVEAGPSQRARRILELTERDEDRIEKLKNEFQQQASMKIQGKLRPKLQTIRKKQEEERRLLKKKLRSMKLDDILTVDLSDDDDDDESDGKGKGNGNQNAVHIHQCLQGEESQPLLQPSITAVSLPGTSNSGSKIGEGELVELSDSDSEDDDNDKENLEDTLNTGSHLPGTDSGNPLINVKVESGSPPIRDPKPSNGCASTNMMMLASGGGRGGLQRSALRMSLQIAAVRKGAVKCAEKLLGKSNCVDELMSVLKYNQLQSQKKSLDIEEAERKQAEAKRLRDEERRQRYANLKDNDDEGEFDETFLMNNTGGMMVKDRQELEGMLRAEAENGFWSEEEDEEEEDDDDDEEEVNDEVVEEEILGLKEEEDEEEGNENNNGSININDNFMTASVTINSEKSNSDSNNDCDMNNTGLTLTPMNSTSSTAEDGILNNQPMTLSLVKEFPIKLNDDKDEEEEVSHHHHLQKSSDHKITLSSLVESHHDNNNILLHHDINTTTSSNSSNSSNSNSSNSPDRNMRNESSLNEQREEEEGGAVFSKPGDKVTDMRIINSEENLQQSETPESIADEATVVEVEIDEKKVVQAKVKEYRDRNANYRQMLLLEERLAKKMKRTGGLLEEEAEEEEESGLQGGLGDFGFDVPKLRNEDEEAAALRIRRDDFDNIVDDISDDEGDEEEGRKARLKMEAKRDSEMTREVVEALREGATGRRGGKNKRGHFDRRELARDEDDDDDMEGGNKKDGNEEGGDEEDQQEEEEDLEEKLLEGLRERHLNGKRKRRSSAADSSSDDDDDDSSDDEGRDREGVDGIAAIGEGVEGGEEDGTANDNGEAGLLKLIAAIEAERTADGLLDATLTEQLEDTHSRLDQLREDAKNRLLKQQERKLEIRKYRQFKRQADMRKTLRRASSSSSQSQTPLPPPGSNNDSELAGTTATATAGLSSLYRSETWAVGGGSGLDTSEGFSKVGITTERNKESPRGGVGRMIKDSSQSQSQHYISSVTALKRRTSLPPMHRSLTAIQRTPKAHRTAMVPPVLTITKSKSSALPSHAYQGKLAPNQVLSGAGAGLDLAIQESRRHKEAAALSRMGNCGLPKDDIQQQQQRQQQASTTNKVPKGHGGSSGLFSAVMNNITTTISNGNSSSTSSSGTSVARPGTFKRSTTISTITSSSGGGGGSSNNSSNNNMSKPYVFKTHDESSLIESGTSGMGGSLNYSTATTTITSTNTNASLPFSRIGGDEWTMMGSRSGHTAPSQPLSRSKTLALGSGSLKAESSNTNWGQLLGSTSISLKKVSSLSLVK